jgi:hypothetical protein
MAGRDWSIEGRYVEYCSCDTGCPCTGVVAFHIDKGHCEGVSLDGIKVVATFFFRGRSTTAEAICSQSSRTRSPTNKTF